jgi:hypothetical protein
MMGPPFLRVCQSWQHQACPHVVAGISSLLLRVDQPLFPSLDLKIGQPHAARRKKFPRRSTLQAISFGQSR